MILCDVLLTQKMAKIVKLLACHAIVKAQKAPSVYRQSKKKRNGAASAVHGVIEKVQH